MHKSLRAAGRYVSGRPLDGIYRTDSDFFHRGQRVFTRSGRASRWSKLPGWQRATWRLVTPPVALGTGVAYLIAPTETTATAGSLAGLGACYGAGRVWRAWEIRQHTRTYLRPLHDTLRQVVGDGGYTPDQWLAVPVDFDREDVESRIWLPRGLYVTPELKRQIRDVLAQKLGMHDPDLSWQTIGARPSLAFRPAPKPPGRTTWGALEESARKASDVAPVIGYGPRMVVVDVDLEADSPHVLVSAGSGGGKSVLIRLLVAQALNRGGGAVFLDYKRHSHRWADGLPGVTYARDVAEIHTALVELGDEAERRNRAADSGEIDFVRLFLVAEEMNATIGKLKRYWAEIREKDDPKESPAITALLDILAMGRAVRIHVLAVAQMMTARTVGGPEARENFATRCLTRCSVNAMKMLVPEVMPIKRPSGLGRWLIVKNGTPFETQVAFMSDDEARRWALAGAANPGAVLTVPTSQGAPGMGERPGTVPLTLPVDRPAPEPLVTLREALTKLPGRPLGVDQDRALQNLRKLAQRQRRTFPVPVGQDGPAAVYRLSELVAWKKRRDAVAVVEGKVA